MYWSVGNFMVGFVGYWEVCLRLIFVLFVVVFSVGGCMMAVYEVAEMLCLDYIGKLILLCIVVYGFFIFVYCINVSQVGYVFEIKMIIYVGGEFYYMVNYLMGVDKYYMFVCKIIWVCYGVYVVYVLLDIMLVLECVIVVVWVKG